MFFGRLKRRPARRRIRKGALVRLTNHRGNPVIFPPSSTYPALRKIGDSLRFNPSTRKGSRLLLFTKRLGDDSFKKKNKTICPSPLP